MSTDVTTFPVPEGPGSVTAAPNLPAGFAETFSSRLVDTGGLRQHVVVGGDGPPLLLVHGWPESWYAWRFVMPSLAKSFTVVAVDQRGMGLTDKPETGYDSGALAADLIALMDALGFDRFAVAGHDTGMVISYALAADNPERVVALVAAEIPGAPGVVPAPPLFVPQPLNNKLWHIPFNRAGRIAEQLIQGHEDVYFGYEFAIQGGPPCPRRSSTTTSATSPTPSRWPEDSGSTATGTRRWRRTRNAPRRSCRSPSWPSAALRATATTSRTA